MGRLEKTLHATAIRTAHIAFLAVTTAFAAATPLLAQAHRDLAPTPPMGWNSWDSYGTTIREDEVKKQADYMAAHLKQVGWQYIIVDIQWYEPNAAAHGYRPNAHLTLDSNGRTIPAPNRFPSAANGQGFKPLADYVHSKGLKFGFHILRGIPRQAVAENSPILGTKFHAGDIANKTDLCEWNTDMYGVDMSRPGAQEYEDSLAKLYASWGADFIKADDESRPYHKAEIEGLHKAIVKSGRPMVLSLSPGPAPLAEVASLRENSQMWRIEDDLWDNWPSVRNMYDRIESWAKLVQPNGWPDPDMLPLGHIGLRAERGNDRQSELTHDEQQTMMTLWSIFRAPLMFGGDLPTSEPFTLSLITNGAVMAVDQHSTGNRVAVSNGDLRVWTATSSIGPRKSYIAVFNLGDKPLTTSVPWSDIGTGKATSQLQNLWTGKPVAPAATLAVNLAPHASALYSLATP